MKIYRCKEQLELPVMGRDGRPKAGASCPVLVGAVFTAESGQVETVRLEGLKGPRLTLSQQTLEKYFEELA